jgi:hypothetical protein
LQFVIDNLSGNAEYVIKICAGTNSLSNANKTWLGEPSIEKVVYLPEKLCDYGEEEALRPVSNFSPRGKNLPSGVNFVPRGELCPLVRTLSPRVKFVPKGELCPLG